MSKNIPLVSLIFDFKNFPELYMNSFEIGLVIGIVYNILSFIER